MTDALTFDIPNHLMTEVKDWLAKSSIPSNQREFGFSSDLNITLTFADSHYATVFKVFWSERIKEQISFDALGGAIENLADCMRFIIDDIAQRAIEASVATMFEPPAKHRQAIAEPPQYERRNPHRYQ